MILPIAPLIIKLSAMLAASLFVERFLYLLNSLINRILIVQSSLNFRKLQKLQKDTELEVSAKKEESLLLSENIDLQSSMLEIPINPTVENIIKKESYFEVKPVLSLDNILTEKQSFEVIQKYNKVRKEFWMQVLGALIAIAGCIYGKFSIWVFITHIQTGEALVDIVPATWEFVFTGIIIGSGSKPINFLMNFLMNRRIEIEKGDVRNTVNNTIEENSIKKEEKTEVDKKEENSEIKSIEERIGFKYDGGDRPGRLENTHLFKKEINLIVYHHTAMHSDSTFDELVQEFDRKGWLTGYNCVILKDGTIRALCRWDRFGNHALPHNGHSLGIALQGNFETNPAVPYSNHDGSYGLQHPTNEQIKSLSKVVALWTIMHNVPFDFELTDKGNVQGILPHKDLAKKACPGNNFPYDTFKLQVKKYHNLWKDDQNFQDELEIFKSRPYVMPKI